MSEEQLDKLNELVSSLDPVSFRAVDDIKPLYQAALGEFLVSFNTIEQTVYALIGMFLRQRGLTYFASKIEPNSLSTALEYLKALNDDFPGTFNFDFIRLKKLSEFRNRVAHGSFNKTLEVSDNGMVIAGYEITPKKKQQAKRITPDQLKEQSSLAGEAYNEMLRTLVCFTLTEAE